MIERLLGGAVDRAVLVQIRFKLPHLNKIILFLFVFALPVTLMWMLFGLAGSTTHYFAIIFFGYIFTIITAILSLFWKPVQYIPMVGIFLVILGICLDHQFWKQHNIELCLKLRADPACIEDQFGFHCTELDGDGFSTGIGICENVPK